MKESDFVFSKIHQQIKAKSRLGLLIFVFRPACPARIKSPSAQPPLFSSLIKLSLSSIRHSL